MFATLSYTACMFLGALNYFCRHVIGRNLRFIERMRAELPVKTKYGMNVITMLLLCSDATRLIYFAHSHSNALPNLIKLNIK